MVTKRTLAAGAARAVSTGKKLKRQRIAAGLPKGMVPARAPDPGRAIRRGVAKRGKGAARVVGKILRPKRRRVTKPKTLKREK